MAGVAPNNVAIAMGSIVRRNFVVSFMAASLLGRALAPGSPV
jgi:hypothetical protein